MFLATDTPTLHSGRGFCVLHPPDCTNTFRPGRGFEQLTTQYSLNDAWVHTPIHRIFTQYNQNSAARLDPIYIYIYIYIYIAQRLKMLNEWKKRPQRILALEKQPQCKISRCGCFKTTTCCGIRETATTRTFTLRLFLNHHNTLWHVKICHDAKVMS